MKKFQTQYFRHESRGEEYNEPSLTVPDMAYSIKDLFRNYTTLPMIRRQLGYDENPDINNPLPIDVDLSDLDVNKERIKTIKNELFEEKKRIKSESMKVTNGNPE